MLHSELKKGIASFNEKYDHLLLSAMEKHFKDENPDLSDPQELCKSFEKSWLKFENTSTLPFSVQDAVPRALAYLFFNCEFSRLATFAIFDKNVIHKMTEHCNELMSDSLQSRLLQCKEMIMDYFKFDIIEKNHDYDGNDDDDDYYDEDEIEVEINRNTIFNHKQDGLKDTK